MSPSATASWAPPKKASPTQPSLAPEQAAPIVPAASDTKEGGAGQQSGAQPNGGDATKASSDESKTQQANPANPATPPRTPTPESTPPKTTPPAAEPSLPDGPVLDPAIANHKARRLTDVYEPEAKKILDRADAAALAIVSLDLETEYVSKPLEGQTTTFAGSHEPCRVVLEYTTRDAISMPRLRFEPVIGGKRIADFVYDGRSGISLDLESKRGYVHPQGFPPQARPFVASMPRWIMERRTRAFVAQNPRGDGRGIGTDIVAARVVGTETVDGEICDVVTTAVAFPQFSEAPGEDGKAQEPDFIRIFETYAFARKDGLPRRIHIVSEVPGQGPFGNEERTVFYRKVKMNEPLPAGVFNTKLPDGFTAGEVPAPSAPPQVPTTAPTTPPSPKREGSGQP